MDPVVIVAAARTPIGRFLGSLAKVSAVDLAVAAARKALADLDSDTIDEVIVGNVLGAGLGMNIARQIGLKLNLPISTPAYSVNMMCASGMQAVILAAQAVQAGHAHVVLAGGTESMSNSPYLLTRARSGYKFGDGQLIDSMLHDGLTDPTEKQHMAITAQRIADHYNISREEQDAFALISQQRTHEAQKQNVFDAELAPLDALAKDEHPRGDTTADGLASLRPAFDKNGSITAGNASGINDGAAMLVVTRLSIAQKHRWPVLAKIDAFAAVGCQPGMMGLGPIGAVQKLLAKTKQDIGHYDHVELNEAFAAQAIACARDLNVKADRLNPHGGAIAIGHPIGASGARLVTHLAHQIHQQQAAHAIASLCVGGGMGVAVAMSAV